MGQSQVQISNLALGRIGAKNVIANITDNTPNAIRINACWDAIFQEVLSERDWKFAKLRVPLQLSSLVPDYGYHCAYALPSDFLRLTKPRKRGQNRNLESYILGGIPTHHYPDDLPVWPPGWPYTTESLSDGNVYLLTDYNNTSVSLSISYIRLITDYTKCPPGFVNCFANRLAQELAIPVTEDQKKEAKFEQAYKDSLNSAQAQNECSDSLDDEVGGREWVTAGRGWWW